MRRFIVCLILLLAGISVSAQRDSAVTCDGNNSFFIEAGGNAARFGGLLGPTFSLNYERIFYLSDALKCSGRIGFTIPGGHETNEVFPMMINLLIGDKRSFFELGVGGVLIYFDSNFKTAYGAFTSFIGYRYQSYYPGIVLRIGLTPTISPPKNYSFYYVGAWAGVSIGYHF